jgi:hypothetical protein
LEFFPCRLILDFTSAASVVKGLPFQNFVQHSVLCDLPERELSGAIPRSAVTSRVRTLIGWMRGWATNVVTIW